jgi:hypothetical protein
VVSAFKGLFDASNLNDEELHIAIRVAHNNLRDRKSNFNEFVQEGAHERVVQYAYLHFIFANMIVLALEKEIKTRAPTADYSI